MVKRKTTRRRRYYPRIHYRRKSKKIPLAPVLGFAASVLSPNPLSGRTLTQNIQQGNLNSLVWDMKEKFTGVDGNGNWHWDVVANTYTPIIAGALIHYTLGKFVNRHLGRIPLVGKYLSL